MLKRRTLVCLALALVAVGVGIYLCLPRTPRFTEEQFKQIQVGMTQAEVEAVVGWPPGNYTQDEQLVLSSPPPGLSNLRDLKIWACDTPESPFTDQNGPNQRQVVGILVDFGNDGKVNGKYRMNYTYTTLTLLQRLRAWVGW